MLARFQHDCDMCIYLGSDQEYDFYACVGDAFRDGWGNSQSDRITLISRYGDEGSQYSSGWIAHTKRLLSEGCCWMHDGIEEHLKGDHPKVQNNPGVKALRFAEAYGLDKLVSELNLKFKKEK